MSHHESQNGSELWQVPAGTWLSLQALRRDLLRSKIAAIAEEDVSGLHYTKLGEFVPKPNVSFWTLRAMLV
jgi:hypothetical protein